MLAIQNNTLSTGYLKEQLVGLIFPNNFEYTIAATRPLAILANPISDTDFCMKMAESSLSEEWDNEDDDYWNSFI